MPAMMQCMSNGPSSGGVTSASSQTYSQPNNVATMPSTNMMSHMASNVPNLHQNSMRPSDMAPTALQNNAGTITNCNAAANAVNSLPEFNLDFLDSQLMPNDFLNINFNDIM